MSVCILVVFAHDVGGGRGLFIVTRRFELNAFTGIGSLKLPIEPFTVHRCFHCRAVLSVGGNIAIVHAKLSVPAVAHGKPTLFCGTT